MGRWGMCQGENFEVDPDKGAELPSLSFTLQDRAFLHSSVLILFLLMKKSSHVYKVCVCGGVQFGVDPDKILIFISCPVK